MKAGSDQIQVCTTKRSGESRINAAPTQAAQAELRVVRASTCPTSRMLQANSKAMSQRPASAGSSPTHPGAASSSDINGGQREIGLGVPSPSGALIPSPRPPPRGAARSSDINGGQRVIGLGVPSPSGALIPSPRSRLRAPSMYWVESGEIPPPQAVAYNWAISPARASTSSPAYSPTGRWDRSTLTIASDQLLHDLEIEP